ncbi:isoaspartyl peptidase/L-asparaginase family protein [Rheinheimera soli]|uniref:isoaspartyl peptidase/L-asparaginase family protein n=1 Tax=Rheinheimera soli TaxID=443616 RepID=UPI001E57D75E|nr:N(4)-(beta-N-acetylglucosaminyl)-L-asparaginase [Rheinheimera soli]
MRSRRDFLKLSALLGIAGLTKTKPAFAAAKKQPEAIVVSTWEHGLAANEAAWQVLAKGGRALDAVETGVRVPEADPKVRTVGYGGYPDRDGIVTLDACIMDEHMNCGSVAFLQNIKHPISVARLVMEKTPHVMLVGEGAKQFALQQGFKEENLLTAESEADWKAWLKDQKIQQINIENHDTIGMLAMDAAGNLSGACTTSGAAYKMHGRVGDSPLIGAVLMFLCR